MVALSRFSLADVAQLAPVAVTLTESGTLNVTADNLILRRMGGTKEPVFSMRTMEMNVDADKLTHLYTNKLVVRKVLFFCLNCLCLFGSASAV